MSDKMRSRTEMVTTTFVDSEEDYSDDDDSEEDWRPSASNKNGKKQKQQKGSGKRGRKRKGTSVALNKNSKRKPDYEDSDDSEEDEASEDNYEYDDYNNAESGPSKKKPTNLPPKKQFSDKNSSNSENSSEVGDIINLLVYVKDLITADPNFNNRLCLWRKDSNNLLQKYIRVKTAPDQFLFTSSSVYSSFDDKRISDFYDIKVKTIDSAYRRVQILNPSELHTITKKSLKNNKSNIESDDGAGDKKNLNVTKKLKCIKTKDNFKKNYKSIQDHIEQDDDEDVEEENEEEQEDCDAEADDDDDFEDDDEAEDD